MKTKKILGLDIGTNSIGGALINLPEKYQDYGKDGNILWLGSRIIPIDGDYLQKFETGKQALTKAAFRRIKRASRRLKHRYKLRRTRLIKVFKALGWLDESFMLENSIDYKRLINNDDEFKRSHHISKFLEFSCETIKEFEHEMGITGLKSKKGKSVVPEDWIVYFLRKKALDKAITIPELVRIIYMLNQRRGFKSSRKDLKQSNILPYEEFKEKREKKDYGEEGIETKFVALTKVIDVKQLTTEKDKNGKYKFQIIVDDERIDSEQYVVMLRAKPDWIGQTKELLVTQKVDKNHKFIQAKPDLPGENDWELSTTALDEKINNYRTPGEYFYEQIKEAYINKRNFKARQFPVYRWRYQKELAAIWNKQCELNPELKKLNTDKDTLARLAEILYPTQAKNNMPKLIEFKSNDLLHIISNDIIYYQRELKSQKNLISECRYEKRKGIDGEFYGLKCIPRSSPLFQEFRIWQDIHNIHVLEREVVENGKTKVDVDVTNQFITDEVKEKLFDLFQTKASISEKDILTKLKEVYPKANIKLDIDKHIDEKKNIHSHRINLFARRDELKGNETLARYRSVFKKANFNGDEILSDQEKLLKLWHIDYSITSSDIEKSRKGIKTALSKLLPDNENKQHAIDAFCKLSELKKEYGSLSANAIKKLLPLMRCGKYWNSDNIPSNYLRRIEMIITGEFDEHISNQVRKQIQMWEKENNCQLTDISHFRGLPSWLAGYIVYGTHSEKPKEPIDSIEKFNEYIQKVLPNNSLRNPIVEQVVRETLFLVRDIWKTYGQIDEIHIELGRNLKNNSKERERIAEVQESNFKEKQRIKALLYELMNGFEQYVYDGIKETTSFEVRPNPESPADINKFRIWRSLNKHSDVEWTKKVKDEKIPTDQEIKKYALWLSQNCRSPYTKKIIPLSKLFDTNQYQIEHIIPKAKMKNDSFNNLVISERGVNKAKGNELAANFISKCNGKCRYGNVEYELFNFQEYEAYCKDTFKFQKSKLKNLLATEVPEDFVERQLNDTRYIGRKLSELLAPVAKNENGIVFTGGFITSELKNNWGLNKVWKEIIKPRFERLEEVTGKKGEYIIYDKDKHGNPIFHFNVKENEQLDTKRIDHRHHALDALIVAATTREHIRYFNTLSAADTNEDFKKFKESLDKGKIRDFKLPWENFTKHAKDKLEELVVTFKVNNKIISKPKNRTAYFNAQLKKVYKPQKQNPKWMAVRRSLFKEPLGIIWLKETKEVSVYDAFKIHIERKYAEKRKTASYIYDKQARQIIDNILSKLNISIDEQDYLLKELKIYLKNNSEKVPTDKINKNGKIVNKTIYNLNGLKYEKIKVAHFVSYKTKRMALTNKDYFENLTIEKMMKDFPYFSYINKSFYNKLPQEHKTIIDLANFEISENRNQNSLNQLFLEHILYYNNNPKEAFSAEGIERLNKNAIANPKIGKEIKKITRLDGKVDVEDKFNNAFYETDKGSNVYFVMYENQQTKEREYLQPRPSIATHKAIEKIIRGEKIAEDKKGFNTIILSPGDLVYLPTKEEREGIKEIDWSNKKHLIKRIYKVAKFTGKECYFIKANISDLVITYDAKLGYGEFGSQNYQISDDDRVKIAEHCIKLKVDRLGNIFIS
jgi:CRISPR-associated endonuclease Csn1